jgi:hypothetical protein
MFPFGTRDEQLSADQSIDHHPATSSKPARQGRPAYLSGLAHHPKSAFFSWSDISGQSRISGALRVQAHPGPEAAGETGWQHLESRHKQSDPVVRGHPCCDFNLTRRKQGLLVRDPFYVTGLFDLRRFNDAEHYSLNGPRAKRHPYKVAGHNVQFGRNAVSESAFLPARAVNSDLCESIAAVVRRRLWARFHQARVREVRERA